MGAPSNLQGGYNDEEAVPEDDGEEDIDLNQLQKTKQERSQVAKEKLLLQSQIQNNAPKEKNVLQMPEEKTRKAVLLVVGGMLAKHIHCVFILTTLDATTHGDQIPFACMDKNMPCKHHIYLMLVIRT